MYRSFHRLLLAVLLPAAVGQASASTADFELISISAAATASGNGASFNVVVSSNGQHVAFASDAANLVANDTNALRDVFWRDRVSGVTRLVSRTAAGVSGNGESDSPAISADGRFVAFHSRASNLVTTDANTNYDVFVWDSLDNSVTLVSRTATGASGAGDSYSPKLSADGRVVSFASEAPDLVTGDTNLTTDAFARDLNLGVTYLASINTNHFSGNGASGVPVLSANGRHVAFISRAGDLVGQDTNALNDVFVHDLQTRVTTLVSVNVAGTGAGNRLSLDPAISADGRYVAFASQATNLVSLPDTNNFPDVFVRDLQLGVTKLVSVNAAGTASGGNGGFSTLLPASLSPFLSADGTKVLFVSLAQDLVTGDTNGKQDVFLRDHIANTTTLISTNRFGTGAGNAASGIGAQSLSADLRYVAFFSEAANLGAADTNNKTDVFLRDLTTGRTKIMSRVSLGGFAANGHSFQPVISADGSTVFFTSEADNLDNRDANGARDVFAAATTLSAPSFAAADVGVSVDAPLDSVVVGSNFTLTVTVTNRSANFVTGLVLSNAGPALLQFVTATASHGTIGTNFWFVGDLPGNATATATLTLVATNAGTGTVTASVLQLDQTDPFSGNDLANALVTASFTGTDLALTAAAPATTFFGSNFLFSLVVSNRGPVAATSVVVTNADPGQVSFVGFSTSQGTVDPANGTWTVGTLAAGATATFTATMLPQGSGFLLFRAGVSSAQPDTHTPNDTVNLGVTVPNLPPSLRFISADPRFAGGTLTVAEDATALSFPAFAQIHPLETNQAVTNVTVVADNPALFAAGPNLLANGTLNLTLAANANGSATVTVTATDNGGTLGGGVPTGTNSFVINVAAVNDAPIFGFSTNHVGVLEDAGGQTLPGFITSLSVGPGDESGQTITNYLVTTTSNALFAVVPAVALNGTLTFTPAANASGSVTVTVIAQDSGGTAGGGMDKATNTFTVTVTAVNDAPSVAFATNNVVVAQDSGARHVAGFATPSFGPADEAGQAVVGYTVTPNSAALFQVAPAISLGGDLTFTPATGASGSTPVTVVVQDSGGTANGGVNLATNTFTLTITAPIATNFTWLGGTGDWHDPAQWTPIGVPGVLDSATIAAGTIQLTNAVVVRGLALASGTITGAGSLTVSSNLSWTSGTFDGAGTLTISAGATATASSASTKTLRRQLDNFGTFIWTGGVILANNNPTLNNQTGALFDIQADTTFFSTTDSSVRTFNNAGTVRKTAGTGITTWQGVFNSTGTVEVQTGTFQFSGGSGTLAGTVTNAAGATLQWAAGAYQLGSGVALTGDGSWELTGGTLDAKAGATVTLPGTFAMSIGTLGGPGNFTVPSGAGFTWISGQLGTGGVFTVASGGLVTMTGASTKTLRRQFDNAGTVTWAGGTIVANNNPAFTNRAGAVFDAQVDGSFFQTTDSSVRTFHNAGTLRKTAGTGTTTWEGILNNKGTVQVDVGVLAFSGSGLSSGVFDTAAIASLEWTSGTHELTNGTTFTGTGTRRIAGGTLAVSPGATVAAAGDFQLSSGTLGGAGNFTVPAGASFTWSAGTMQTGGVFSVATGGVATWNGTFTKTLRRQVDNAGIVTWTQGTILANNNPTFNNLAGGVFDVQVDGSFFQTTDSSVRTFNNLGLVRKTAGTGTATWEGVLNNTGTLAVQVGTLSLTGSGLSSGAFTNAAGTLLAWTSGTHELTNAVTLTGPGTRRIAGATLNVGTGASVSPEGTFELVNGTLGGAGNFTVPSGSQFNWQAGTMQTGGVFTVAAGGTLAMSGTSTKTLRRQLDNAGTVTWSGGVVIGNNNPTVNNQAGGVFDIEVDNTFFSTTDSSVRVFNNAGTLRKTAGGGTTTWEGVLNNAGTLAVQTGTLSLNGSGLSSGAFTNAAGALLTWTAGTHELTNGAAFTGPGTRRIAGGTLTVAPGASVSPEGTFELVNGTLGGAGNFTVPSGSQFNWQAGTMQTGGVFTVAAGGTLTLGSTSTKTLRRQFDNAGTVTWTGGTIQANSNPTFNNQGGALFDVQSDNVFFSTTDSSVRVFNNLGTLRKTVGAGTTTWEGALNNDGTLAVQSGTLSLTGSGLSSGTFSGTVGTVLSWTSGTHQLTNGAAFTGPGMRKIFGGTVELTAGTTISPEGVFEQAGGILGGLGNFTLPAGSQYEWQSGTIHTGGVFTVAAGGTMTLTAAATKVLRRTFNNAGTVTWQNGTVQGNSNPTFNNLAGGLLDVQVDNTFFATSDSSVPVFNNSGTLRKSAGGGTTTWANTLNNIGTLDVQTGTFSLTGSGLSSGVFTGLSGAVLVWTTGTHVVTNGATFTGPATRRITSSATLEVATGTTISPEGLFELTSGTLGGLGNFTVPSGSQFNWSGGTLGTGGVFTVAAGGTVTASTGTSKFLRRQLDNHGTFTWIAGQVAAGDGPTFNNQAGALFVAQSDTSFFNNVGGATPVFNNFGTLRRSGATNQFSWFGTLNQNGALELQTGTLVLGSTPNVGAASSLTVFLGGTTAGTEFGRLVVGDITFAGSLNVVLTNGFVPALSNSFHIIDGGTGSGVFTNTTGRFVAGGLVLETNYSGGDLTLQALAVNTAPTFTLTNFPATDGVQSWMRDAESQPGAGRRVAVDASGNVVVAGDYDFNTGEGTHRDLLIVKYQSNGTPVWTNRLDAASGGADYLRDLVLDSLGNVLLLSSAYSSDTNFVTTKYLANGTLAWTATFNSGGEDVPAAIAVDLADNVIVTGSAPVPLSQLGVTDYLTIKYGSDGTPAWTNRTSRDAGDFTDTAAALAVDSNGDVIVTGSGHDVSFANAFTVKISGVAGTNIWARSFSYSGSDDADGVAVKVDSTDVFVAINAQESGIYKMTVLKYNSAGEAQWTNNFTRAGVDASVRGLALDDSGHVLLTGVSDNGSNADYTTLKLNGATGAPIWTNHFNNAALASGDSPAAIVTDSAGNVYVTGHSTATSGADYLTVKYTSAGTPVWTNRFDSAGSMSNEDKAYALAVDTNGSVYVTGESDTLFRTFKYAIVPSLGAGQSVGSSTGAVTISGFVVSSSVGTSNESSQTLSFLVTNDNNGLFTVQPAISPAGVLTYTVNPANSGVAVVTVRAMDSGGGASGGTDTSAPQSFSITVLSGTSGVAYTWAGGTGPWHTPANWSPIGVPGVADTVTISSGNAQVTNAVAVSTLTLTGGFISGAGSLSIRSAMTWSGGTLIGAGTTTIANGAVLTVSGAAEKDLRRRLDNYGTVTWTGVRILGHDAAAIYNYAGALFDTQTDATLFESGDGTVKTFNNFGTVRKSAGTGTSTWSGTFNNSGTVNMQTGTLNPSGTVTLNNSTYTGTGQFMLTGATLAGTLTIAAGADVDFASGSLLGTGTIVGTMSWTGGTFGPGGTTTIATNGVLLISGATQKDLRHTLDNYGTVTWSGERILGHQAPIIINRAGAVFDVQANTTLFESGDGTVKNFNNSGTVRRTVGTGTTTWNGRFNNDAVTRVETGVVELNGGGTSAGMFTNLAGATLEFTGGTHTLNHGATFTGAGTNLIAGGTVNVSAGATATAKGISGLASGALGGTGTLLVAAGGQFGWTGGTMDGTTGITLITNGATMIVSTGADKDLRRRLDNYGTVTWTAGRIIGHASPTLNNYAGALFDTQTDSTLFESGDGTIKTFNNFGTVRKSGGTGTSTWNGTFNHSGAADVLTGTLNPDGAVTLGNSSYSGAGRYLITGATLAGTLTIATGANVEISGSSVGGSGTVVGTLNWTSGTLGTGGTLTIATNGVLVASTAADKDLRQTLDNYGTVTWTGGRIVGHGSPVIVNRPGALFDAQANATLYESGDGTIKTFNNSGTVRRTVGTGTTTWNGLFNNNAVLRVETGLVALNGGGTSAGTFTNLTGATLEFSGGTHTLNDGTLFTGAGTNLIDGGTVNVSTNATATATGTFTLSTGTLGGTGTLLVTSGSQFNWTGGTMAGTTGITVITNGATLIASSGADKDLRRRLDNYGTLTWTAGRIVGHSTPVINNLAGALFDTQVDATLFESGDGTIKTFNNGGTVRKSGGTGTSSWLGAFNHSGTANVQTGTLNPVGTVTATTASYSGTGRFLFTTGTLSGTQTVAAGANVELASGSLFGTWTLAGTMNWTSGTLGAGGSTTIPAGSTLLASGAADKDLRRTLNNSGTVLWTAGRILGHSTPVINNLAGGVFEMQADTTLFESGDGTIKTFNNSGTVRKSVATGTSTFHGTFNNSSVLEIQLGVLSLVNGYTPAAGSTLRVFLGGLTAGTQFGQLNVNGTTAFNGSLAIVLTNSFAPALGNTFLVVNSGSGSGAFASLTGDSLGGGLSLVPTYLVGDVTLTVTMAAGLPPLSPQAVGTERLLRWAGDSGSYLLETAPSITGPWTPVLAPVAQENGDSVVRLPAEGTRFYRLVPVAPPRPGGNPTQ